MTMTTSAIAERKGPPHRHKLNGNMWYIPPSTGEKLISVTSVFDYIAKEELDKRWRPGLSAKAAFAELPRVVAASLIAPCGRTNNQCDHDFRMSCADCPCGDCRLCVTKWLQYRHFAESTRAADRGTAVHDWIEQWVLTGGRVPRPHLSEEIAPYIVSFLAFTEDMGLTPESWEMTEATVLNRADGWGGTLDAHIRFDATATKKALALAHKFGKAKPLVTADTKSREGEGAQFYPDNAKQLSAYCRGEVILFRDGREEPLPPTDGGLVIQVRPDGYSWRRVDTSERTYRAFLANRETALWEIEHGTAATQVKSFPDLDIPDLPAAPAKATRPRKAAVPKTNGKQPGTGPNGCAAYAGERGYCLGPGGPHPGGKHWFAGEPEPTADPARTAPAKATAAPAARRSVAERIGAVPLSSMPAHPDSPYGDPIPF